MKTTGFRRCGVTGVLRSGVVTPPVALCVGRNVGVLGESGGRVLTDDVAVYQVTAKELMIVLTVDVDAAAPVAEEY